MRSSTDQLIRHCLKGQGTQVHVTADTLSINLDSDVLEALPKSLHVSPDQMKAMTIMANYPSIKPNTIAFTGSARDHETGENIPNGQLRFGWCLMEDRAGGVDHYLRLDWPLAFTTICPIHKRPLIERCQKCYL